MNFVENIDNQIDSLSAKIKELNKTRNLINVFPDIREIQNRWKTKFYTSLKVNAIATNVTFSYTCGCCNDAPLLARFYVVYDGIEVNADPYTIAIGEKNICGYGDIPNVGWRDKLIEHNINPALFSEVEKYFAENPPESYEDIDEEWENL
ncbi:MAG: hypothetical protein K0R18_105 [Bacillales bacterium]|jgi:hypothetical protein|nr:hypothetical protein [Bacillales bacterium]